MSEDPILRKFEEYMRQGKSTREAVNLIREELMALAQGKLKNKTELQRELQERINKLMSELRPRGEMGILSDKSNPSPPFMSPVFPPDKK